MRLERTTVLTMHRELGAALLIVQGGVYTSFVVPAAVEIVRHEIQFRELGKRGQNGEQC